MIRSPPFPLLCLVRTPGTVKIGEFLVIQIGQREVEDLRVRGDVIAIAGRGEQRDLLLNAPAQQDLRGGASVSLGDGGNELAGKVAPVSEWAIGLEHDIHLAACVEEAGTVLVGAELDLVDRRSGLGGPEERRQLCDGEVRDADRFDRR